MTSNWSLKIKDWFTSTIDEVSMFKLVYSSNDFILETANYVNNNYSSWLNFCYCCKIKVWVSSFDDSFNTNYLYAFSEGTTEVTTQVSTDMTSEVTTVVDTSSATTEVTTAIDLTTESGKNTTKRQRTLCLTFHPIKNEIISLKSK